MELIVEQHGVFLGKHSERLRMMEKKEVIAEHPLMELDHVIILSNGVSISSDLLSECAVRGIAVSIVGSGGEPLAQLVPAVVSRTVLTRRSQLRAYDNGQGVTLARQFALGKLANQANLLKYLLKNRAQEEPELAEHVREAIREIQEHIRQVRAIQGATPDDVRQPLMTVEAHAARSYWEAARRLVIPEVGWEKRETRGATDLVNSCLNYGYAILAANVGRAVIFAGLDPYAGYLHADRAGKPSLVLDLMEQFRQMVVDRAVFGLLNLRASLVIEEGLLTSETRKTLAAKVLLRLETEGTYQKRRVQLRSIIQAQARRIAAFLRGEEDYQPWWANGEQERSPPCRTTSHRPTKRRCLAGRSAAPAGKLGRSPGYAGPLRHPERSSADEGRRCLPGLRPRADPVQRLPGRPESEPAAGADATGPAPAEWGRGHHPPVRHRRARAERGDHPGQRSAASRRGEGGGGPDLTPWPPLRHGEGARGAGRGWTRRQPGQQPRGPGARESNMITVTDLKQHLYCPRVVYHERALGKRRPRTFKMEEGIRAQEREAMLEASRTFRAYALAPEQGDGAGDEKPRRFFDVWLTSDELGLSGRVDLVVRREAESIPVDFKMTSEGVQANHRLQLASYALLLESAGWPAVRCGFVYLVPTRQAVRVEIDAGWRARVREHAAAVRALLDGEKLPDPTPYQNRCQDCEFRNFCNDVW